MRRTGAIARTRRGVDDLVLTAAGVLARDRQGRCLLTKITYDLHHPWAVPGGGTEVGETPRVTAARELAEELGLDLELAGLACVDYSIGRDRPPIAAYLYWLKEPLTSAECERIRPQPSEVASWSLHTPQQCGELLPPRLGRRVTAALAAADNGHGPVALVAGRPHDPEATVAALTAAERAKSTPRSVPPPGVTLPMNRTDYIATRPRAHCAVEIVITRPDGCVWLTTSSGEHRLPGGPVPVKQELPQQTAARITRLRRAAFVPRAIDWVSDATTPTLTHVFTVLTTDAPLGAGVWVRADDLLNTQLPRPDAERALSVLTRPGFIELVDGAPPRSADTATTADLEGEQ
ncbi:NUDIX domain-containing protein [Peterkaempfera griseoplana]|uniref:NUDIX domain-containing protein n=1 Tax=Peterkaempfera griseoplana TaxID=66896 RepID=UPI0006E45FAD|nr:NUDIX hydrolase [Peterkaempfera griseoplana]